MRVEGVGLNRGPDTYYARSLFVCSGRMIPFAICLDLVGMLEGGFVVLRGIPYILGVFLSPVMITLLFLIILRWYLENNAKQSLSQSLPMEIKEPVLISLKMYECCTSLENSFVSGTVAWLCGIMSSPLVTWTSGPMAGVMSVQYSVASLSEKL